MSKPIFRPRIPLTAASAIGQYLPVTPVTAASALTDAVQQAASLNDLPLGFTTVNVASPGPVGVLISGIAIGVAAASLGAGCQVGVGSSNGRLVPVNPSGLSTA